METWEVERVDPQKRADQVAGLIETFYRDQGASQGPKGILCSPLTNAHITHIQRRCIGHSQKKEN